MANLAEIWRSHGNVPCRAEPGSEYLALFAWGRWKARLYCGNARESGSVVGSRHRPQALVRIMGAGDAGGEGDEPWGPLRRRAATGSVFELPPRGGGTILPPTPLRRRGSTINMTMRTPRRSAASIAFSFSAGFASRRHMGAGGWDSHLEGSGSRPIRPGVSPSLDETGLDSAAPLPSVAACPAQSRLDRRGGCDKTGARLA